VRKTDVPFERDFTETDVQSPFSFCGFEDKGDVWCFNSTEGYGKAMEVPELVERRVVEKGDIFTRVKQSWKLRDSILEEYITRNYDGTTDWRCRVNWNEKHAVLKVIPKAEEAENIIAAVPAGSVVRPMDGREYPAGEWLKWGETTLLTEGIFAYDTDNGIPRLTILRSPIFGDLRTKELNYDLDYQYMGQGIHEARIKLIPDNLTAGEAAMRASQWNAGPIVVCEANHEGSLPSTLRGFSGGEVNLTAVKPAEDGNGYVVRISEMDGRNADVKLIIVGCNLDISVAPYEIKTLRISGSGKVSETDMLEGL